MAHISFHPTGPRSGPVVYAAHRTAPLLRRALAARRPLAKQSDRFWRDARAGDSQRRSTWAGAGRRVALWQQVRLGACSRIPRSPYGFFHAIAQHRAKVHDRLFSNLVGIGRSSVGNCAAARCRGESRVIDAPRRSFLGHRSADRAAAHHWMNRMQAIPILVIVWRHA
jgi:hypothetical protein